MTNKEFEEYILNELKKELNIYPDLADSASLNVIKDGSVKNYLHRTYGFRFPIDIEKEKIIDYIFNIFKDVKNDLIIFRQLPSVNTKTDLYTKIESREISFRFTNIPINELSENYKIMVR